MQETQEPRVPSPVQEDLLEKEDGNLLQYSCLENPMDRGAWQATVHEVSKSETWLSMHLVKAAKLLEWNVCLESEKGPHKSKPFITFGFFLHFCWNVARFFPNISSPMSNINISLSPFIFTFFYLFIILVKTFKDLRLRSLKAKPSV